jgi:hypothetical protein
MLGVSEGIVLKAKFYIRVDIIFPVNFMQENVFVIY